MNKAATLSDWGEFRLINEIILPELANQLPQGDDCAYMHIPDRIGSLAITTDVGPQPLVWQIGHESYFTWGWYAVAINASDLASAGAEPLAFASSVEAPGTMRVEDFREFFAGVASACKEFGFGNAGGNIREAPRFACHGTAIGSVSPGRLLRRSGCKPGDRVVAIGDSGKFVSAFLRAKDAGLSELSEEDRARLLTPRPRLGEMVKLRREGFLTAASDNSDGVLGALWNIAQASNCGFEIEMSDDLLPLEVKAAANLIAANPWNLMFCWGDWQVICAVHRDLVRSFDDFVAAEQIAVQHLGWAISGPPSLSGLQNGARAPLRVLRNENFTAASFNHGIAEHLSYMLHAPLFRSSES